MSATAEIESRMTNLLNDKLYLSYNSENIIPDSGNSKELKISLRARGNIAKYELISNGKIIEASDTGEFTFPVITSHNGTEYKNPLITRLAARKDVRVRVTDVYDRTSIQTIGIRVCELGKEIEEVKKTGAVSLGKSVSLTMPDDVPFLGGKEISYGLEDALPFDLEAGADGKVKIAINKKSDQNFERFKEEYDNLSSRALDLSNAASSFGGTPQGFGAGCVKVTGSVCGYGEGYFDELDQGKLIINVGVILSVNASAGYTQYFFAGAIPFYVTVEGGIKVSAQLEASMLYQNDMLDLSGGFGDMTGKVYLTAGAGVGAKDLVDVGVSGTGDVNVLWKPSGNYWKIWASLGMAIHSNLFGWSCDLWESPKATYQIYEAGTPAQAGAAKAGAADLYDTSKYSMVDRSYLNYQEADGAYDTIKAGTQAKTDTEKSVVKQAVYPQAEPKLVEVNGTSYLFWLEDIEERTAENRSALVYATSSDGRNFTSPKQLIEESVNQTADYDFDLYADSGSIYICWLDGQSVLPSGAQLADVTENLGISYARLNTVSNQVEEVKTLTEETGCYLMPKITLCGGKPYAAWVQCELTEDKNVLSAKNIHTVNCMDVENESILQYTALSEKQTVISMDIGLQGNQVAVLCEVDEDGNLSSVEDRELYMDKDVTFTGETGSLTKFTSNSTADISPAFTFIDGEGSWLWYQDGNICYTKNLGADPVNKVFEEGPANLSSNFSVVENNQELDLIIWEAVDQEAEDESTSIYAASYKNGAWTPKYRLCNTESAFTSLPNGYSKNGTAFIAYTHSAWQKDGSVICSLCVANQPKTVQTSLESISYDVADVVPGANLPLSVLVKNQGSTSIDTLEFSTESGVFAQVTDAALKPGESKQYEIDGFVVDSGLSSLTEYPVYVKAQGESEDADNEYRIKIGYTDLCLEASTRYFEEANWLDISVLNNSCIPSKGTLTLYGNKEQGDVLWSRPVDTVTKEQGIGLSISLEEYDKEYSTFYLCIEAEKEESILTNSQQFIYTGYGTEIKGGSLIRDPKVYTVTFDSNGGSQVESQDIAEGNKAVQPPMPTKEGCYFAGWYLGENPFDFNTIIEGNLTLTAKWETYKKAAKPDATISSGTTVAKNTKVSLTCATLGARIYYTTDGTLPTESSVLYTSAITLNKTMTIKAIAVCDGYQTSDVAEFSYKVKADADQQGNGQEGSQTEKETIKVSKLTITAPSKKLAAGKKVNLTINVTPANAANKAVTWKTSNKKYATISSGGKLTLKKAGIGKTVTITATAKDGSGKTAKIKVKIMKHAVKSIKLTAPAKTLKAGKSMTVKTTIKTTGKKVNKTLTWKSSNKKYAAVNKKGKVTAKKAGKGKTVTITATSTDGSNKKAKVKIKIK